MQSKKKPLQSKKKGKDQEYQYKQAPHMTQDTNEKVTTSQSDNTNESQKVSPFPAGDHKASKTDVHESITKQNRNNINDPQKKHRLGTVSKNNLLEDLNRFHGTPISPLVQMWIKTQTQNINNTNGPQKSTVLD